jgi:phage terminase small subunit
MSELGLTPAALQRLRLIVEAPEEEAEARPDPYAHLRVAG